MKSKMSDGAFMIIETPVTQFDLRESDTETVYSLLALYPDGDMAESCFVYDIARKRCVADYILAALKVKKPKKDALSDTISEIL